MQALYTLPPDKYAQAVDFANARHALHFAGMAFTLLALYALLRLRVAPRWRRLPAPAFFAAFALLLGCAELPLDALGHAASLRFGISIERWPGWFWDWTKEQATGAGIAVLLGWPFYWIAGRSPRRWWLWSWLASLPLLVAATFAGPLIFEPMFNRFTPLAKTRPDLVASIERLLAHTGVAIPPERLFEMAASEKTNALNAYVSGFGPSRRLVLYDTIIHKEDGAPLLTTVGHEVGHYALDHIAQGLVFGAVGLLAGFLLVRWAAGAFLGRWGAALDIQGLADRASLPALLLFATLAGFAGEPIGNAFSRHLEHEADRYSLDAARHVIPHAGQAAAQAFQIEGETDLDVPDPDPFIVFWLYSHPPTAERLKFSLDYAP